jgi:hypothetical protein
MTNLLLIALLATVSPSPGPGLPPPSGAEWTDPDSLAWPRGDLFTGFS